MNRRHRTVAAESRTPTEAVRVGYAPADPVRLSPSPERREHVEPNTPITSADAPALSETRMQAIERYAREALADHDGEVLLEAEWAAQLVAVVRAARDLRDQPTLRDDGTYFMDALEMALDDLEVPA